SRSAAVGLVVDLPGAERREVAVVEEPQVELVAEDRGQRPLLGQPRESVGNQGEEVELHQGVWSAKPRATTILPAARSISLMHSSCIGSARPESSSSTSFATPGETSATRPSGRPPSSSTASPTSWKT